MHQVPLVLAIQKSGRAERATSEVQLVRAGHGFLIRRTRIKFGEVSREHPVLIVGSKGVFEKLTLKIQRPLMADSER